MAKLKGVMVKVGGIALVTVALSYAFDPNWPIPLDQVRGSEQNPDPTPVRPVHSLALLPDPDAGSPAFLWRSELPDRSWRVVLLDDQRQEIAWGAPTDATIYRPEGEFREALAQGRGRFWCAVGEVDGRAADHQGPVIVRSAVTPIAASAMLSTWSRAVGAPPR